MTVPFSDFTLAAPVRPVSRSYAGVGKRLFDISFALFTAPVVIPVLALILLATWVDGGRPLYAQPRVGRDGRLFRCWKVRTMVRDADDMLARLMESDAGLAAEWHDRQKLVSDPRITRLGRLLRRASLDELPQLWNVLNGTMSLIGPRPFTPDQQALYADGRRDAAYYRLRPGISGLWQVRRRNAGSFVERVQYDQAYGRSVSLRGDLAILWQTFAVVLRATGL